MKVPRILDRKADLDEEIRSHIEMAAQELREKGKPADEALVLAKREFGNIPLIADITSSTWRWLWLEHVAQDVRLAFRRLWRSPGYAATGILTIALGIGAVAFMLTLIDSVLLRPISLPHPEGLVTLAESDRLGQEGSFSRNQLEVFTKGVPAFEAVAEYISFPRSVRSSMGTTVARTYETSPNFFSLLGVKARQGRVFAVQDARADVAVISYAFWRDALQGDQAVVGKSLTVYGRLVQVIGVMPEGFRFPPSTTDAPTVALPFNTAAGQDGAMAIARLRDGASINQANVELNAVYAHSSTEAGSHASLRSYGSSIIADEQPALLALLGAAFLFLLISCTNVAILQIIRGTSRMAEMKLRSALGASRAHLLQQIVMESLTMSLIGAAVGLFAALVMVKWTRAAYGAEYPRFNEIAAHPSTFVCGAVIAVLVGLLAACAPSTQIFQVNLKLSGAATRTTSGTRVGASLVILEISLTCTLLVATGLLLRAFQTLESTPPGFNPDGVTSVVLLSSDPNLSGQKARSETQQILGGLASAPGIVAAATQTAVPFSPFNITVGPLPVRVISSPHPAATLISVISSGYARTMQTPVLQGRSFDETDHQGTQAVCVINRAFVQKFLSQGSVLGEQLLFPDNFPAMPLRVIGVAADELAGTTFAAVQPTVFLNYEQFPVASDMSPIIFGVAPQLTVRSRPDAMALEPELRAVIQKAAPDMAIMSVELVQTSMQKALSGRHLALRLGSAFSLCGLFLAAVGVYGVLAYSVVQRQREIGIRMALGCSRRRSLLSVVMHAAILGSVGLVIGSAAAWMIGRVLHSVFLGAKAWDSPTVATAAVLLLAVCGLATALPAWRASRIDPMEALRTP